MTYEGNYRICIVCTLWQKNQRLEIYEHAPGLPSFDLSVLKDSKPGFSSQSVAKGLLGKRIVLGGCGRSVNATAFSFQIKVEDET